MLRSEKKTRYQAYTRLPSGDIPKSDHRIRQDRANFALIRSDQAFPPILRARGIARRRLRLYGYGRQPIVRSIAHRAPHARVLRTMRLIFSLAPGRSH